MLWPSPVPKTWSQQGREGKSVLGVEKKKKQLETARINGNSQ